MSPDDLRACIWDGTVVTPSVSIGNSSNGHEELKDAYFTCNAPCVVRTTADRVAYTDDGRTAIDVPMPISFFNTPDVTKWAASALGTDFGCLDYDPGTCPITVLFDGQTLKGVTNFAVHTVATSPADAQRFKYFDLLARDADGNALVWYGKVDFTDPGQAMPTLTHSSDQRDDPELRHWIKVDPQTETTPGVLLFQVHGYKRTPLTVFANQKNLVKATLVDGTTRYLMVPWNLSEAALPGSALTAHWLAATCNADGTYTLVSCFRAGAARPLEADSRYETACVCDEAKRECALYARAVRQVIAVRKPEHPPVHAHARQDEHLDGSILIATMMHTLDVCGPIPTDVLDLCNAFGINPAPVRLTHGVFGLTAAGVSNLGVMPTLHVPADPTSVHLLWVKVGGAYNFDFKPDIIQRKARCIVLFEDNSDVCYYPAAVANPKSTLLVRGPDGGFTPVYGALPPGMDPAMFTKSVDLHQLMEWHRADNAIKRHPADAPTITDHFAHFTAAVGSDRWVNALMYLLLATPPETWAGNRRAYAEYLEDRVTTSPALRVPIGQKLSASDKQELRVRIALRRDWRTKLRVFMARFWLHPLEAVTIAVAAKLDCDPQALLRKTLSEQQTANFAAGLTPDRVYALLEALEDLNGTDLEFMMVDRKTARVAEGTFDIFAVAACWDALFHGQGLSAELPAKPGRVFVPVPVLSTAFVRDFNPSTGLHAASNDALYNFIMWSSAALCCAGHYPKSEAAMSNLALFYQRAFRQCTSALSPAYTPDPEQTTTAYLRSLRLLVFAIFGGTCGRAGSGMLFPSMARYYFGAPLASLPAKRSTFDGLPAFVTENKWIAWAFTSARATNNGDLAERVLRTCWGDTLKQLYTTHIGPYAAELTAHKQREESFFRKRALDRANRTLLYQLVVILVGIGACTEGTTIEDAVRVVFSCSLKDLRRTINCDSAVGSGHHRSTALLERFEPDSMQWPAIIAKRFVPWFGRKGTQAILDGGIGVARRCVVELVTAPNPAESLTALLGPECKSTCMPFRADSTPLPVSEVKKLLSTDCVQRGDPDALLATAPQECEQPVQLMPPCLSRAIAATPDHEFDPPRSLAQMGIAVPWPFMKELVVVLGEHWSDVDAGICAGFELLAAHRFFLNSTL